MSLTNKKLKELNEIYTIGRTMQVCLEPNTKSPILSRDNFDEFFDLHDEILGENLSNIMKKMLGIKEKYQSFSDLE